MPRDCTFAARLSKPSRDRRQARAAFTGPICFCNAVSGRSISYWSNAVVVSRALERPAPIDERHAPPRRREGFGRHGTVIPTPITRTSVVRSARRGATGMRGMGRDCQYVRPVRRRRCGGRRDVGADDLRDQPDGARACGYAASCSVPLLRGRSYPTLRLGAPRCGGGVVPHTTARPTVTPMGRGADSRGAAHVPGFLPTLPESCSVWAYQRCESTCCRGHAV